VIGPAARDEQFVSLADFYRIPRRDSQRETMLHDGQWVTHVLLPPAAGRNNATYEVRQGAGPDYPLAAAAAALWIEGGIVRQAQVVLGQVAPIPWVSRDASQRILGLPIDHATAEAAGRAAVASATPLRDNVYKVQLAKVAVKRALLSAAGLETGGF
jgi:xanthine dehydrogenase YagS FAD-binding subunit